MLSKNKIISQLVCILFLNEGFRYDYCSWIAVLQITRLVRNQPYNRAAVNSNFSPIRASHFWLTTILPSCLNPDLENGTGTCYHRTINAPEDYSEWPSQVYSDFAFSDIQHYHPWLARTIDYKKVDDRQAYSIRVQATEVDVEWISQSQDDCLHPNYGDPHRH